MPLAYSDRKPTDLEEIDDFEESLRDYEKLKEKKQRGRSRSRNLKTIPTTGKHGDSIIKIDVDNCTYFIKPRPYASTFLKTLRPLFNIVLFSLNTKSYVNKILQIIDPDRSLVKTIVTQESFGLAPSTFSKQPQQPPAAPLQLFTPSNFSKEDNQIISKIILKEIRQSVLMDCNIVFSGLFPKQIDASKLCNTRIYQMTESFGAKVQADICESTTHLIFIKEGTSKVIQAIKAGIKVVHYAWLRDSIYHWELMDESRYSVDSYLKFK
eukprot:gene10705-12450_t